MTNSAPTKRITIEVIAAVGDRVYIPDMECHATVKALRVAALGIDYLVAWFHDGKREEEFVTASEIRPAEERP